VLALAQNDTVRRLEELGFEIISITEDVLVCKLDPKGPEPDDGRSTDLCIDEEQCRALHRVGRIVFLKVEGIADSTLQKIDEKPRLHVELRRYTYR
jgi:hypothetical protein